MINRNAFISGFVEKYAKSMTRREMLKRRKKREAEKELRDMQLKLLGQAPALYSNALDFLSRPASYNLNNISSGMWRPT